MLDSGRIQLTDAKSITEAGVKALVKCALPRVHGQLNTVDSMLGDIANCIRQNNPAEAQRLLIFSRQIQSKARDEIGRWI